MPEMPKLLKLMKFFQKASSPTVDDHEKILQYNDTTGELEYVVADFGSTGSGGTSGTFTYHENLVVVGTDIDNIPIGIDGFNADTDFLTVFDRGARLYRDDDWILNADKTSINLQYALTEEKELLFIVLKAGNTTSIHGVPIEMDTATVEDGQVLTYDAATSQFILKKPEASGGGGLEEYEGFEELTTEPIGSWEPNFQDSGILPTV